MIFLCSLLQVLVFLGFVLGQMVVLGLDLLVVVAHGSVLQMVVALGLDLMVVEVCCFGHQLQGFLDHVQVVGYCGLVVVA